MAEPKYPGMRDYREAAKKRDSRGRLSKAEKTEANARRVYKLLTGRDASDTIRISGQGDRMTINDVVVSPLGLIAFVNDEKAKLIDSREVGSDRFEFANARKAYKQITGSTLSEPISIVYRKSPDISKYYMYINDIQVLPYELKKTILKDTTGQLSDGRVRRNQFIPLFVGLGIVAVGYYLYRRK